MLAKFQYAVHRRDEITYVKLSGVIDEDNELLTIADEVGPGTMVADLKDIERINSCGVRDWVNWLGKVEKGGARVVMSECSPAIVAQINLVNNFTGNGVVKSFYAPYFCPQCDHEKVLLIETRDAVSARPFKAPSCRCDECDGPMDFDDMEDSFFAFLGNAAKIITDARVDEVVAEFTPSDGSHQLVRPKTKGSGPHLTPGQSGATLTGSMPSSITSSAQALARQRTISGNHSAAPLPPNGRGLLPPPPEELSKRIELARTGRMPTGNNKMILLVAGVVIVLMGALIGYIFFAQSGSSPGARPAPTTAPPTAPAR